MFDKSIYSILRQGLTGREHIRVAVIGAKGSGKTVFLTSLTNHLRNHDPELLNLDGWSVVYIENDAGGNDGIPSFQYAKAREQLGRGEWPDNTRSLSVVRLKLRLEKKGGRRVAHRTVVLELLDIPGERVADLSMFGRSFREWCEWMEARFCGVEGNCTHYSEYVGRIEAENDGAAILSAYKDCVSKQYEDGLLTITPSVLKLGADGEFRTGENAGDYRANIASACIGVDDGSQFAPLPRTYLDADSAERRAVVNAFQKAYGKYRSRIVDPIGKWLSHVNKAVFLVDVLSLLREGPKEYNAEQNFAEQALKIFRRPCSDSPILKGVQRLMGAFVRTRADGVYVVATKSDTVVGEQNRSRMKNLAYAMMKPALSGLGLPSGQWDVLSCASVLTAEEYLREKALEARVEVGKAENGKDERTGKPILVPIVEKKQYSVSDVPMEWPDDDAWQRGGENYDFRPTFPKFDKKSDRPPRQLGLDYLARLLLSL